LAAEDGRVRAQRGIMERFTNGLRTSRLYLPEMERIFRAEGLPVELTRLPLIESCFDVGAYSKVGAAGIWQFMPATARLYMEVNDAVDERRDPIASTYGAAQYLTRAYQRLGTWPLAITSYNHGQNGIARAIDEMGTTDIVRIIHYYDGPSFGFASRNFYAEFLAALDIEKHQEAYLGRP
jgi:membrane-bound lytic murein transglycosylase D